MWSAAHLLDDGEHVAAGEDQQVLAVDGDLGAAVLRVDDGVADLDVERDELAGLLGAAAGADGEDLALLGLLLGGVGDDEAGLAVVSSASLGLTTMRSSRGFRFIGAGLRWR